MKRMESRDQLPLLYRCSLCRELVPYPRALLVAPWSLGDNSPLHESCTRTALRWFGRAHLTGAWDLSADNWVWVDHKAAP